MPQNWKTYKLGELYNSTSGLSKSREEFGFGNPFVTFKNVFYNYFLPDKLTELANTNEREVQRSSVLRGDLFLTRTSETLHELGMSSVALKDYPLATFNGFCKRLRLKEDVDFEVDPTFIGFYLRSSKFRSEVGKHSTMTTRASLNNNSIASLEIDLPPFKEQIQIGKILKSLIDKIELNLQMNKTLEEMAMTLYKHWFIDFEFPHSPNSPPLEEYPQGEVVSTSQQVVSTSQQVYSKSQQMQSKSQQDKRQDSPSQQDKQQSKSQQDKRQDSPSQQDKQQSKSQQNARQDSPSQQDERQGKVEHNHPAFQAPLQRRGSHSGDQDGSFLQGKGSYSDDHAPLKGRGIDGARNTVNYMSLPYNPALKERAKALRKAGNLAEVLFWQQVHRKKFLGLDFDRQKIIGNYIVDFYCANVQAVVEIDGSSHDNKQEYDAARDAYLESLGLTVIHITDDAVLKDLPQTMEDLKNYAVFQVGIKDYSAFQEGKD